MKPLILNASFILLSLATAFGASSFARADVVGPSPSPSSSAATSCNQYCDLLVNGKGKVLGLNGTVGWTVADDQWCADHGAQTNSLVGIDPVPTSAAAPPGVTCGVPMINGDTNCAVTEQKVQHCQWHNGQVEQQCEAYEAADQGQTSEKMVLALDIAATGTCATACALNATAALAPAARSACRYSGTGASLMEVIQVMTQKSSAVGKIASGAMAAVGLGRQVYGAANFQGQSTTVGGGQVTIAGSQPTTVDGITLQGTDPMTVDLPTTIEGDDGAGGWSRGARSASDKGNKHDKDSCMSMVLYGLMTVARIGNISADGSTKSSACNAVLSLASQSPTAGYATLNTGLTSGASAVVGTSTGLTNSGSSGLECVGSGGSVSACTGASATASDVAALQNSGLGAQVAPAAAQLAASPLGQSLGSGGDVGQAINAAGGANAGDAGSAIATAASAAQAHALELSEGVEGTAVAGGGAGGGEGGGEAINPMAALAAMLNPQSKDQAPVGGTLNFRAPAQNADIYHTSSDQNLFQIISGRIQKASSRVQ